MDAAAATQLVSSAAVSFGFTSGAKTGTPATTGSVANWSAQTFTDSATAGSGTATAFVAHGIQRPTLAATNASVTTTDAATVYIANSPLAGTNETITNAWALWVDDGAARFDGDVTITGVLTATPTTNANLTGHVTSVGNAAVLGSFTLAQLNTAVSDADLWSTGDAKLTLKTVADAGWVMADDGTIGNAASGGTTRANADTVALFTLLWNNVADAQAAVSGGRGANAAADYAADKTIALTKMLGRALGISGAGSGLTSRVLGLTTGNETETLSIAQLAVHGHIFRTDATVGAGSDATGGFMLNNAAAANVGPFTGTPTDTNGQQIGGTGSGSAHANMQPTGFLNCMIKL